MLIELGLSSFNALLNEYVTKIMQIMQAAAVNVHINVQHVV